MASKVMLLTFSTEFVLRRNILSRT